MDRCMCAAALTLSLEVLAAQIPQPPASETAAPPVATPDPFAATQARNISELLGPILKKHDVPEDEEKRAQDEVQKLTDKAVLDIDKLVAEKEKEMMAV